MPARKTRTQTSAAASGKTHVVRSVDALRRILRQLRVVARKTELATGLSAAQMFVLSAVADAPGCSVNDIAAATMTDRSSAAAIVDRLVDGGYITREQSGEDRRRATISLTARGRRAKKDAPPPPTALLLDAMKTLTPAQLRNLADGLDALTEGMGVAHQPAGMFFEDARPGRSSATGRSRRK